jgi:hypothetical protein
MPKSNLFRTHPTPTVSNALRRASPAPSLPVEKGSKPSLSKIREGLLGEFIIQDNF